MHGQNHITKLSYNIYGIVQNTLFYFFGAVCLKRIMGADTGSGENR